MRKDSAHLSTDSSSPTAARSRFGSSAHAASWASKASPSTAMPIGTALHRQIADQCSPHRPVAGQRELPARRPSHGRRQVERRPGDPSRLRLPVGAAGSRGGVPRCWHHVRWPSRGDTRPARATRSRRGAGASDAGVPVVPGTFEPIDVSGPATAPRGHGPRGNGSAGRCSSRRLPAAVAVACAASIGGSPGGGNLRGGSRGRRRLRRPDGVPGALCRAGAAHRGPAPWRRPRHVVALGERDCSVQRRHQKLVEEAPAPGLTTEQRRTLHDLGVRVARTVGLRNAATAEFLFTPDGDFWFLEVNARLQVEHGVTELVADIDLVHEQLWIAASRPISDRTLAAAANAATPAAPRHRGSPQRGASGAALCPGTGAV